MNSLSGTAVAALLLACLAWASEKPATVPTVVPRLTCAAPQSQDQDDMCFWVHPTDPARSLVIASDKKANRLFVYDLEGKTLQTLEAKQPGNIDVRTGFLLGKERVDIVAFNQRADSHLVVYRVDPATRRLIRVDNGAIATGENYGGTLYRSPKTGKYYFVVTSKPGLVTQIELNNDGKGRVGGEKVRTWRIGKTEAAVADDETGQLYIADEERGVWQVGGEPGDPTPGRLVIRRGEHGLVGDVEGLALYPQPGGAGYLVVSNQRASDFKVYQRGPGHAYVGTFRVQGARDTDGLDICSANLGPRFPRGLFACHTATKGAILLVPWEAIARTLPAPTK
ncbi:MAG: phytase [Gemmataceae bacterium]